MNARRWSAEAVAAVRAASHYSKSPQRHDDWLAAKLIGEPYRTLTSTSIARFASIQYFNRRIPGIYYTHWARTKFFDQYFAEFIQSQGRQAIILGAGLDSRAYRLATAAAGVSVCEVDLPHNSRDKRRRIRRALPGTYLTHVQYIERDIVVDGLENIFASGGLDDHLPTLVVLEGVSMYLPRESFQRVLAFAAGLAIGSVFLFDFFYRSVFESPSLFPKAARHFSDMNNKGEPYRWGMDPDKVEVVLAEAGLRTDLVLTATQLETHYLAPRNGRPAGRTLGYLGCARASVTASR